jgi:proline racemase
VVEIEGVALSVDLAYGGVWYAIADAGAFGLELDPENVSPALQKGKNVLF